MCYPRFNRACGRHERGAALVVALLVFSIAAALLVAMQRDFDMSFRRAANSFIAEQSWAYLEGAEALAAAALRMDFEADLARGAAHDSLDEIWAQQAAPYALDEGGWMYGSLSDLQGRFNLNSLGGREAGDASTGAVRYTAAQETFIRLLQALDGIVIDEFSAVAIAESIADWIDADEEPRLNGAESSFYATLTPSYRPANQPMASVSELRAVANVTPELFAALRPHVSVWPREPAGINIHTATLPVLRALNVDDTLQPLSADAGLGILQQREEFAFTNREEFLALPAFASGSTSRVATLLAEASSYFLLSARVEIADREQRLYSVLRRSDRQIDVLRRSDASLYDMGESGALRDTQSNTQGGASAETPAARERGP